MILDKILSCVFEVFNDFLDIFFPDGSSHLAAHPSPLATVFRSQRRMTFAAA